MPGFAVGGDCFYVHKHDFNILLAEHLFYYRVNSRPIRCQHICAAGCYERSYHHA